MIEAQPPHTNSALEPPCERRVQSSARLPRLRPPAFSKPSARLAYNTGVQSTRHAQPITLASIASSRVGSGALVGTTAVLPLSAPAVSALDWHRVRRAARGVVVLIVVAFGAVLLVRQAPMLGRGIASVTKAHPAGLVLAGVLGALTYVAAAMAITAASGRSLPLGRTSATQLATACTNRVAPAGTECTRRSHAVGALAVALLTVAMIPAAVSAVSARSNVDRAVRHVELVARPGDVVASRPGLRLHVLFWSVGVRENDPTRSVRLLGLGNAKGTVLGNGALTGRAWMLESVGPIGYAGRRCCAADRSYGALHVVCFKVAVQSAGANPRVRASASLNAASALRR